MHCGPCRSRCDDCPVAWERFKPAPPASPEDSERWWKWVAHVLRVEYQHHHLESAEELRRSLLRAATACESAAARRPTRPIQPAPPID